MSGRTFWRVILALLFVLFVPGNGSLPPGDRVERVRAFTRAIEFNFVMWTLDALAVKAEQLSVGGSSYLSETTQRQIVLDYLDLIRELQTAERGLSDIYADPSVLDPEAASQPLREELQALYRRRATLGPMAESALQRQINAVLAELGLTLGGQTLPPVLYRTTPIPLALVVSPREVIRQDANISIDPGLTIDQRESLEARVDQNLDVSSLVVPIGGIGLYPTMVMHTTDVNWLAEVVAHEWIHNYLTLRPLGLSYFRSPELRTINETTASIAGKEIGRAVIARFYPEHLPPPPPPPSPEPPEQETPEPPAFDFRAEMRVTRLKVDELLAEGEIERAEAYMEERRRVFWDHGYRIRKLNQAYFAFYGAYADQPGGAAGDDPVGGAVRALRDRSPSLAGFINRISWIYSYEQLQRMIEAAVMGSTPKRVATPGGSPPSRAGQSVPSNHTLADQPW
jgi:hypothetical protein